MQPSPCRVGRLGGACAPENRSRVFMVNTIGKKDLVNKTQRWVKTNCFMNRVLFAIGISLVDFTSMFVL